MRAAAERAKLRTHHSDPRGQGGLIDEGPGGACNKRRLGLAYGQAAARVFHGLGVELTLKDATRDNNLWDFIGQGIHHRVLPAMVNEDAGARQELSDVETGRAGHFLVPHSVDGLGHARDVDVAAQRLGEFSPGAHGHARGDATRPEVDEDAIARRRRQCGCLVQEPAVDSPLPRPRFQGRATGDEAACHPLKDRQGRGRGGHSHLAQQASNSRGFARVGSIGGSRRLRATAHARDALGAGGDDGGKVELRVDDVGARGSHVGAEDLDGGARVAFVEGTGQPEDLLEAAHGLAPHEADARGQGEGVARDGVWQAERRGHRNLERRAARIDTVTVVSPRESDLVAAIPECLGDTLRARPWTTHLRTGKHGDDENLHVSRVRHSQHSLPTHNARLLKLDT